MGVVEGYQAQNTQIFAARVGLDATAPFDDGSTITVPAGGVVEVNGVMYRIANQFSRAKPNANTAYWIVVVPSPDGSTASFDLVTRPGVWNHARNGCYFTSGAHNGRRTLNWVSLGNLANVPADGTAVVARTNKTGHEQISLAKGWHFVRLGSGLGGGNGGNSTWQGQGSGFGGGGGVASVSDLLDAIFFAGKPLYGLRVGGGGANGAGGPQGHRPGGGGGSGSGEETVFHDFSTAGVRAGDGGRGSNGAAGEIGQWNGGRGSDGVVTSSPDGEGGGGTSPGGPGGAGGQAGLWRAAGSPGGFCRIFLLGN